MNTDDSTVCIESQEIDQLRPNSISIFSPVIIYNKDDGQNYAGALLMTLIV